MKLQFPSHVLVLLVVIASATSSAFGFVTTVSNRNGAESDAFASGQVIDEQGAPMANWELLTTVSNTDFLNDAVQGGISGLQYVMYNEVASSTAANRILFSVVPMDPSDDVSIRISQSIYNDTTTWNGGDSETSQFYLTWDSPGLATIHDPDNQLLNVADGDTISTSTTIRFADDKLRNNVDSWAIDLPVNATDVEVNWSSADPNVNSTLTREWVSFATNVVAVPEPNGIVLMIVGGWMMMRRRKVRRYGVRERSCRF